MSRYGVALVTSVAGAFALAVWVGPDFTTISGHFVVSVSTKFWVALAVLCLANAPQLYLLTLGLRSHPPVRKIAAYGVSAAVGALAISGAFWGGLAIQDPCCPKYVAAWAVTAAVIAVTGAAAGGIVVWASGGESGSVS